MAAQANQVMTEFCEQGDPRLLSEMRPMPISPDMLRIQQSWMAAPEKRALLYLAARTPEWVNPDQLTVLGLGAQIGAGAFYALAKFDRLALIGVIACLALNWLGDSLDGTLARVREQQRPRYGFYVDHMVDTFGALALMAGLAASGYIVSRSRSDCSSAFLRSRSSRILQLILWASSGSRFGALVRRSCAFCSRSETWPCSGNRSRMFSAVLIVCSMLAESLGLLAWQQCWVRLPCKTRFCFIAKKGSRSEFQTSSLRSSSLRLG